MTKSGMQIRKAVNLDRPLRRDLALYALVAGAAGVSVLALSEPAGAQIVYTPAHRVLDRDGVIGIDLNHDGITDVVIRESPWVRFSGGNSLAAVPVAGGGIQEGSYGWAAALWPGSKIGPQNRFTSKADAMVLLSKFGAYHYASWAPDATARYLGITFLISGEAHYGWARLTTRIDFQTKHLGAILTGYAYETQPGHTHPGGGNGK